MNSDLVWSTDEIGPPRLLSKQEEVAYEEKTEKREDEEEQLPVDRRETSCRLIGYQRCQSLAQQDLAGNRLNAHEISSPSWPLLSGE
ncbi:hypothetical protein T11_11429 [Trichinella zimbabwensis]|uniref:Uncharacterized protein n=1 Tax=Trichinella zimbabwensis TaxID=268475 RepID=A0A0V1HH42_9BILA|nr:hypothetical protein T11_11429 [Trichinella zimbabwensis]